MNWREGIKGGPIDWLMKHASFPVRYQVYRDLLDDGIQASALRRSLPECHEVKESFNRQLPCGGWFREGDLYHRNGPEYGYGAIQQLDRLADYGLTISDPRVQQAVGYFLSFRTKDGRFFWNRKEVSRERGEYGCWVALFYEGCTVRALLQLGVPENELDTNLRRILELQLDDGSWAVRYSASGRPLIRKGVSDHPLDRIWGTTLALYALQASSHNNSEAIRQGANYLLDRLFEPVIGDKPSAIWFYYSLRYPDFYSSVLRSLESATWAGFGLDDERLDAGVSWLLERQSDDGVWRTFMAGYRPIAGYNHIIKNSDWVTLRVLRVIKRAAIQCKGEIH